jgi:hypothetical protein
LKTSFKRPNKQSPYEKFSRACLWEWFITSGELKPKYKHAMGVGTTMKSNKKSMHALEDYLKVHDSLVVMLWKMRKIGQSLSIGIVQPIFHGMIKFVALNIL